MSSTEIIQKWLGTKPFVLIELTGYEEDESTGEVSGLKTDVRFGGGIVERSNGDEELDYVEVLAMLLQGVGWKLTTPTGEAYE